MTAKKSVLMEACIERGWKPSGAKSVAKSVNVSDDDSDSVVSAPPKRQPKKVETRKPSKKAEEPVFRGSRTEPPGRPKKDIQKPTIGKKSRNEVD